MRDCETTGAVSIPFAAVLLAGGRSRRMGRDKALLPVPGGGLLWERQLALLRSLGPAELFISGPARPGFPDDVPLLTDEQPGLGPLSGIAAALASMRSPLLVVLAIDLPMMRAGLFRTLLADSRAGSGAVPQHSGTGGFYEPLAAVYPRECLGLARMRLASGELALQGFVHAAGPLLRAHAITRKKESLFVNWNEPGKHFLPP